MMTFREVFTLYLLICVISANPQRDDQLLNDRIQNVFGSQNQIFTDNRGGFADIVTPEPENLAPTLSPQVITSGSGSCKCVPYWMCAPENNPKMTTDSRFFGEIDVRYECKKKLSISDLISSSIKDSIQNHVKMFLTFVAPLIAKPKDLLHHRHHRLQLIGLQAAV